MERFLQTVSISHEFSGEFTLAVHQSVAHDVLYSLSCFHLCFCVLCVVMADVAVDRIVPHNADATRSSKMAFSREETLPDVRPQENGLPTTMKEKNSWSKGASNKLPWSKFGNSDAIKRFPNKWKTDKTKELEIPSDRQVSKIKSLCRGLRVSFLFNIIE